MFVSNVIVSKHPTENILNFILESWMVSPCILSSVYELKSGYISPASTLSFLPKQWWGKRFVIISTADGAIKTTAVQIEGGLVAF